MTVNDNFNTHPQADTVIQSWQTAEDKCGAEGGHLASVFSEAENSALFYYARQQNESPVWIGLKKVILSKWFNKYLYILVFLVTLLMWVHNIIH